MSLIAGMDPGATGWVVLLDSDGIRHAEPLAGLPGWRLADVLRDAACVWIERQAPMPKQGVSSMFALGRSYGWLLGVAEATRCPIQQVRPLDWQRAMLRGEDRSSRRARLEACVLVASRLWPGVEFRGPRGGLLDGKAAAALIAEYGRRQMLGGSP